MESRKMVLMNLLAGQQWKHRRRKQTWGHSGGSRGWAKLREKHRTVCLFVCLFVFSFFIAKPSLAHRNLNKCSDVLIPA